MASRSLGDFERLLSHVDHLIEIPGKIREGRGRRFNQEAVHRAGVVMTVAVWQSYIEKVTLEVLDRIESSLDAPDANGKMCPHWEKNVFQVSASPTRQSVAKFSTPNTNNVYSLFKAAFDFDPRPNWGWHHRRRQWSAADMVSWTDQWVRIRHSIAHGNALPDNIEWIKDGNGNERLTLNLLKECRAHFNHLAVRTDAALSRHLSARFTEEIAF